MSKRIACALTFVAVLCLAAKERDWRVGKVLDSKSSRSYVQTGASTTAATTGTISSDTGGSSNINASTTAIAQIHQMAIQDTQLLIVGQDYAYVIDDPVAKSVGIPTHGIVTRAIINRGHGCRFVVNEDIKYAQDKAKLYVLDADGKECKLDIVRQERLDH